MVKSDRFSSPSGPHDPSRSDHTAELLVHVARLVHGASADASLTPAQWTALRYFASANRFSRTPSAFSEFNATTRGTASQTVKTLIAMGLLERRSHETDGRSAVIDVTEAGRARLAGDPLRDLVDCVAALSDEDRMRFSATLGRLGADLARRRAAPLFGQCDTCGHCDSATGTGAAFCRCTRSMLDGTEMDSLCVDFVPATRPAVD